MERLINNREIPQPQNKLIFIDLDKTLIDTGYNLTDDQIFQEISKAQKRGWTLGLSSDTPLEPLRVWAKYLGLNGPIIAEKGMVISIPGQGEKVLGGREQFFQKLKTEFIARLIDLKIPFLVGDVTQFIRNNPSLKSMVDPRIVAINGYRKASFSYFTRAIDTNGFLQKNLVLDNQMAALSRSLWSDSKPGLSEDFNPEYGFYCIASADASKRLGTTHLMSAMGLKEVGMIGDSKIDNLGGDIAIHYAVGNASQDYKEASDYISSGNFSSGVAEILSGLK